MLNNNGIYGADRRTPEVAAAAQEGLATAGFASDPAPTAFVPNARYHQIMEAFGGRGMQVNSADELGGACARAFAERQPCLINVMMDPVAGVESGSVHAFNVAPTPRL